MQRICLTEDEFRVAWANAGEHHLQVLRRLSLRREDDMPRSTRDIDIGGDFDVNHYQARVLGALGEYVVAKYTGIRYLGAVRQGHADLPYRIEVRTREYRKSSLFLYEKDKDDAPYVLVIGRDREFDIIGWIYGRDGKRPEYWTRRNAHGNWPRHPCFVVPREVLRSPESLRDYVDRQEQLERVTKESQANLF